MTYRTDVLVIGAGQAGLAMGHVLTRTSCSFALLDAHHRLGQTWRDRWDSLRLFTPARYSRLPGLQMPLPQWSYPGKDDVADYLENYANHLELPVHLDTLVTSLQQDGDGFAVDSTRGAWRARQVVVATGPFQTPAIPTASTGLASRVVQLHSSRYRRPGQLPGGTVLVVGGGNSGYQIALELARSGRQVHLSRGEHNVSVPQRPLGRDIFWWQKILGLLNVPAHSALGRRMQANDRTIIAIPLRELTDAGITLHRRVVDAHGCCVKFHDATSLKTAAVVWATGFRTDHSWIQIPQAFGQHGAPLHHRGISPVRGLYFLGLPWLHTTGSALLGFVSRDAVPLAATIESACCRGSALGRGTAGRPGPAPGPRPGPTPWCGPALS